MPDSSSKRTSLAPDQLRWRCDPAQFEFATTADVPDIEGLLGQERAETAIAFGLGMQRDGYNLFVLGPPGAGKRTVIRDHLEKQAKQQPRPSDWCYVNNFVDEDRPKRLPLPAGRGRGFAHDMGQLVGDLQSAIPAALEAEDHRRKIEQAEQQFQAQHEDSLNELAQEARDNDLEMIRTPTGIALAPVRDGQVISPEDFNKFPKEKQKSIQAAVERLQPKLQAIIKKLPQLKKQAREKVKELHREATQFAIGHLISPLKEKYKDLEDVVAHLTAVETDVIEHADEVRALGDAAPVLFFGQQDTPSYGQYLANLIVDHLDSEGAPVIFEEYPYYHNLVGRVEHESQMGSLITDFTLIKAGALHQANGGYLVLQARDLLMQPFAWDGLKRALRARSIQIESLGAALSLISTVSLQPEPIPLDVKVVLLGDRLLYYLLQHYDPDFDELFKIAVDFSDETQVTPESCQLYARLLASLARAEEARPLNPHAIGLMIEQSARRAGDRHQISTHMRSTADLLREADYWAKQDQADVIDASHVQKAIEQQIYRLDRIRQRINEEIQRGTILVDVSGEQVGQVNALSVMQLGQFAFGRPSRITATARLGRGKVVDIEREVELGGAIHSKGVMILSSLLASRYASDCPLSLTASLVFEQSYGMVDGDSASMAEFCALLSVLGNVPIQQGLAITGSVNQRGQAQAIGGVNEKIEGFYDVCNAIGLTGEQAVLVPAANARHLMLRPDVVDAVSAGKFAVYTYENADQAISLLTGSDAGARNDEGQYPSDSINGRVYQRLREMADQQRTYLEQRERGER